MPLRNGCRNDDVMQLIPLQFQSLFQFVQISDACFVHLLTIFSTRCYQLDSNLATLETTVEVGINFGVSLSNTAIVARARWAFQVSQGSVETLFRWGGKRLHHVAANLFRKLCAKFRHNCPSFVGDITENILVSFFPDTVYKHQSSCSPNTVFMLAWTLTYRAVRIDVGPVWQEVADSS